MKAARAQTTPEAMRSMDYRVGWKPGTRYAEWFEIRLPADSSQEVIDYARAELALFQEERDGIDANAEEIRTEEIDGEIRISFPGASGQTGRNANRLLWPNARDTETVLAELGLVKPV